MNIYQEITERIIQGGEITKEEAVSLLKSAAPRDELHEAAHKVTEALTPKRFDFCGIVNAKCGLCSENCKWCAQSAHWKTGCETFPWIGAKACLKAAQEAEAKGATRFGLVTSGRALDEQAVRVYDGHVLAGSPEQHHARREPVDPVRELLDLAEMLLDHDVAPGRRRGLRADFAAAAVFGFFADDEVFRGEADFAVFALTFGLALALSGLA